MLFNCSAFSADIVDYSDLSILDPKNWTFELIEEDEDNEVPSIFFFQFKKDPNWDAYVPFTFEQNGYEIPFGTEMELFAEELENGEDDVESFREFLKLVGFEEVNNV